jgi:hypothetical protein
MRRWMFGPAAIMLASCGQSAVDTGAAEGGVTRFRRQMDARRFHEIYANATPEFRQSGSEATLVRFLDRISTRLGRVLEATRQGWRVTTNTSGTYVSLTYATTFHHGRGNEEFVFRMDGQQALLAGYHINSMDLVIDEVAPATNQAAGNEALGNETRSIVVEAVLLPPERPLNDTRAAPATR